MELRSLTYSLADEEAAKERAVADATRHAVGRASAALEQKGQKLGALRYVNVDVRQPVGIARLEMMPAVEFGSVAMSVDPGAARAKAPAPMPTAKPERITVTASVQCIFQIQ